jgi:hypothetical protein
MFVFLWPFCLFYGQMVYFVVIRYILWSSGTLVVIWYFCGHLVLLWSFGTFLPVLVCYTEENLATSALTLVNEVADVLELDAVAVLELLDERLVAEVEALFDVVADLHQEAAGAALKVLKS